MELDRIHTLFGSAPALKLLRSDHAPFVIFFLHQQFRGRKQISVDHEVLRNELIDFQCWLGEHHPGTLSRTSEEYLTHWCKEENRILLRRVHGDCLVYQLTAQTEMVLHFVEKVLERDSTFFVGTESRMRRIVDTLREIVVQSSDDPELHIKELESERALIDARIRAIRETGDVKKMHDAQIRERFIEGVSLLRNMLSDFRQVEDSFRQITREVQQRDAESDDSRGKLLGFALDAEEELHRSDQGISFAGFQKEILIPEQQEKIRHLVSEVRNISLLNTQHEGLENFRNMMPRLTEEANQVMQTMRRLSASIRRFLDAREAGERRQISQIISEIRRMARECANEPPPDFSISIEHRPEICTMSARDFWAPPASITVTKLEEADQNVENREEAFSDFARMRRLDWNKMRDTIRSLTTRDAVISLPRLLEEFPPKSGAVEVLAYIQIAKDDDHVIIEDMEDQILLPPGEDGRPGKLFRFPKVVFRKQAGVTETIQYQSPEDEARSA